ncbi:SDR family NAD(P)-dependent oxidoreductase [Oceanibium sediminis]|uniref:SDR family NAD(P)-dependent oxidoreductase n=1 Tax=Oceanibium sediminis TaxID=2026339 RepID=UPI000DD4A644|nr:SDR family NAD(P)-dependent oxidoreductase [Oceanibium sediminis]
MDLTGKTAIVTGASSGIGRAIALRFARAGASVVAADVTKDVIEGGAPVVTELAKIDPKSRFIQTDVSDAASVERLITEAASVTGRLDVLVNNAAVGSPNALLETDEAEWDRVMAINLKGPYLCCRAAIRVMRNQDIVQEARGRIVNISSQHGMIAAPGAFSYGVSKAGVAYMTRQIATDYAADNIICNAVAPGKIVTGKGGRPSEPDVMAYSRSRTPMPRLGKPNDVAGAALYLASDEAQYITGHNLLVDGGWMAA